MSIASLAAQRPDDAQVRAAIAAYEAGELERALAELQRAPALLSNRDAAIRGLYLGLVHFALGDATRSRDAFMRAVLLDPSIELDPAVHSPSRIQAFETARAIVVEGWRTEATAAETRADTTLAKQRWEAVLTALPDDREARARLDALAPRQPVSEPRPTPDSIYSDAVTQPEVDSADADLPLRNPGGAFALGLLVPGGGEFYAGRTGLGFIALAAAGGAIAAGYLYETVDVRCASEPTGNHCPPDDVVSETTDRPYLGAAIAAAAGITVLAALDAFLAARRWNAELVQQASANGGGIELLPLTMSRSTSGVRVDLVRFRF